MTFLPYSARNKDVQDHTERHIWSELKYESEGSIIKVKGTESEDEEAFVLNIGGAAFKLKKDHNAEVLLLASSSDSQLKFAVITIPTDKQRRWPENEGGIQHPTDDEFALHFSDKLAHVTKNKFAVGEKGEFEIKGSTGIFRCSKVIIDGELIVNKIIKTPQVVSGTESPPGFEGNKQEKKQQSGGGGGGTPAVAAQFDLNFAGEPTQIEMNF